VLNQRRELLPTSSSSSVDAILQIPTHTSSSFDTNDFISDTSTTSSVTATTNTIRSLTSTTPSRYKHSSCDRMHSLKTRPLLSEYQQKDLNHIDYKILSPVLNTNIVPLSSPISSLPSSSTSFTCPKGHEESSTSPIGSSLNQYTEFTSQTPSIDSIRDDCSHSTTTARSIMTMSISPNRHHNQTHSLNSINTMTNNNDGLKQQRDQKES
jgi:hypothetical protein